MSTDITYSGDFVFDPEKIRKNRDRFEELIRTVINVDSEMQDCEAFSDPPGVSFNAWITSSVTAKSFYNAVQELGKDFSTENGNFYRWTDGMESGVEYLGENPQACIAACIEKSVNDIIHTVKQYGDASVVPEQINAHLTRRFCEVLQVAKKTARKRPLIQSPGI
jgi:hypothetical protein